MESSLFVRPIITNNDNEKKYLKMLSKKLNISNIELYYYKNIYNLFDINFESIFLAYRFKVLKEWIYKNEVYNSNYLKNLLYIIDILNLNNHLNGFEKTYIEHIESINFNKTRNLKKLIVDFDTFANEEVWYKYSCLYFFQLDNINKKDNFENIYLSNKRIIISTSNGIQYIRWKNIEDFKLINNYIQISFNNKKYVLISNEVFEIYVSVERIGKIINIKF